MKRQEMERKDTHHPLVWLFNEGKETSTERYSILFLTPQFEGIKNRSLEWQDIHLDLPFPFHSLILKPFQTHFN